MNEEYIYVQKENKSIWNKTKEFYDRHKIKIFTVTIVVGVDLVGIILCKKFIKNKNDIINIQGNEIKLLKNENISLCKKNILLENENKSLASAGTRAGSSIAARKLAGFRKSA